jgi:ribosomal protein L37AE/L43A
MIGTKKKPFPEILETLEGYHKVGIVGCDGCAKTCATGGSVQVEEMAKLLKEHGKKVLFDLSPHTTCNLSNIRSFFAGLEGAIKKSDALLVLGCGGAVQIVRQLTEEYGFTLPVKSGLDTVGHMDTIIPEELLLEQCSECGDCFLNRTAAICPVTKCAKSLLNGPCGGSKDGKCEVDPARDCAWVLIYRRKLLLGELDGLRRYVAPRDHSRAARPRTLYVKKGEVA